MPKQPWHIDAWDSESGQEMEVIDHKHCVEVLSSSGSSILLPYDDALHTYRALERWLASKADKSPVPIQ